ncbi:polymeric immunoglobulin receptor-like isoform X2 [Thunnus thynnus]|uniref:polymeric immunoglobulin receptor-like isoform X2 n=1 Tax=Thunnus thynnus TaxID=8237 RepID=UPI0035293F85
MAAPLHFLLILTGLTGIHSLTTVKKVSVKLGSSISIPCLYSLKYKNHVKYLCKGYYRRYCSYAVKTNQDSSSKRFSISDDPNQGIFTVTIKDLTTEDTDYWCFVEIDGGADVGEYFQLSVTSGTPSLSVTHQKIMGFYGDEKTINCSNCITGVIKWCKLDRSCVSNQLGSIDGTNVTIVTGICNDRVTMSGLRIESSGWYLCVKGDFQMPVHLTVNEKSTTTIVTATATATATTRNTQTLCCSVATSLIITLSLLIFIVMVALFICFLLKKHKQTKEDSSATTMAEEEVTYSTVNVKHKRKRSGQAVPDAIYGNVDNMRKASVQRPCAESDVNVIYTAVVTQKQQHV